MILLPPVYKQQSRGRLWSLPTTGGKENEERKSFSRLEYKRRIAETITTYQKRDANKYNGANYQAIDTR